MEGWRLICVADLATPRIQTDGVFDLIEVRQQELDFTGLSSLLPWRHYARKNLGYLYAMQRGATCIYDTDDDNEPIPGWVATPGSGTRRDTTLPGSGWINIHAHFGDPTSWPRGFPLQEIVRNQHPPATRPLDVHAEVVVWQGLVCGDPDVDAIFRLTRTTPIRFEQAPPLVLAPGCLCPFNSQNTTWSEAAFPYLYLPSTVSFRFTDILRGYVALRCFQAHGWSLGFHGPTAFQERNPHNLLNDFRDELPIYLHAADVLETLRALTLGSDPASNLRACYTALSEHGWVRPQELSILEGWLETVAAARGCALARTG